MNSILRTFGLSCSSLGVPGRPTQRIAISPSLGPTRIRRDLLASRRWHNGRGPRAHFPSHQWAGACSHQCPHSRWVVEMPCAKVGLWPISHSIRTSSFGLQLMLLTEAVSHAS